MLKKHHGGQDKAVNDARGELLGRTFSTRSWKRIERLDLQILQEGRNSLWMELEGALYHFMLPTQNADSGSV